MTNLEHWEKECLKKKRFSDAEANQMIKRVKLEGVHLFKYKCPNCTFLHLTKRESYKGRNKVLTIIG